MPHDLDILLDGLASPDPAIRDGWAYNELAEGIKCGRFADDWARIRSTALTHLEAEAIQARAFAPLILTWLVAAGDRDRSAFDAVARWYPVEPDTRGYDDQLGWLHTVAHGADYLGECAQADIASGSQILGLLAERLLGPGPAWHDQEYARVARAAMLAFDRCNQGETLLWLASITGTLDEFARTFPGASTPPRPPAWIHNTYTTCACLYVALGEQLALRNNAISTNERDALADILSRMTPWLFAPRV